MDSNMWNKVFAFNKVVYDFSLKWPQAQLKNRLSITACSLLRLLLLS